MVGAGEWFRGRTATTQLVVSRSLLLALCWETIVFLGGMGGIARDFKTSDVGMIVVWTGFIVAALVGAALMVGSTISPDALRGRLRRPLPDIWLGAIAFTFLLGMVEGVFSMMARIGFLTVHGFGPDLFPSSWQLTYLVRSAGFVLLVTAPVHGPVTLVGTYLGSHKMHATSQDQADVIRTIFDDRRLHAVAIGVLLIAIVSGLLWLPSIGGDVVGYLIFVLAVGSLTYRSFTVMDDN